MSVSLNIENFSIKQICDSGQCFRMRPIAEDELKSQNDGIDIIEVIANGRRLVVKQYDKSHVEFLCTEEEFNTIWSPYFDLDTDYKKVIKSIDKNDTYLLNASEYGAGIRILNQDLWEMIISFIISQRNNIKRIRKTIQGLSEKYGEKKIDNEGVIFYDFPKPEALYQADIDELKTFGVGYRDKYILKAAETVYLGDLDLDYIKSLDYIKAKQELLKIYGVGEKVADCIALFALHHTESFPKDTHIFTILDREYPNGFPFEKYKKTAGILQQYMFFSEIDRK